MQQMHQLHEPGPGLAPIQSRVGAGGGIGGGGALPGLAELTTGVSPYSTPAYVLGGLGPPGEVRGRARSEPVYITAWGGLPGIKRRASPGGELQRESSRRRR
ncbi:hypothetical protein EV126DRAFT_131819 [Verticillium dahliae]|nr:hypothetical protein EV126DRAFT_131819 [Verticillium dahliae]